MIKKILGKFFRKVDSKNITLLSEKRDINNYISNYSIECVRAKTGNSLSGYFYHLKGLNMIERQTYSLIFEASNHKGYRQLSHFCR